MQEKVKGGDVYQGGYMLLALHTMSTNMSSSMMVTKGLMSSQEPQKSRFLVMLLS
jgi:hypothetical protein